MTAAPDTTSLPAGPGPLDPGHEPLGVLFMVRHLGLTNVRGRFDRFDATLDVGESLTVDGVAADMDLSSVNTDNADRDAHLRSTTSSTRTSTSR